MLKCIDHAEGSIQWKQRGYGVGSLLLAGNRIIALSDQGELLVIRATPEEFALVASAQVVDGKCWTPPVLSSGLLYICQNTPDYLTKAPPRLLCYDLRG